MIETIQHNGNKYPAFQGTGFAARFAFPFAQEVCKGKGYDIGCNRLSWALPGAVPVDLSFATRDNQPRGEFYTDALQLPAEPVDYIFSSHCLEHLPDWVGALDHWGDRLRVGGVLFLYLPHPSQTYWQPWHNRKHIHSLQPETLRAYLVDRGWRNIFVSGADLNNSFYVMAERGAGVPAQ